MGSVAFLFAGQGAQHPAMGVDLIEASPAAAEVFAIADEVRPGTSEQCRSASKEELSQTENTQPCVFVHDLAAAAALREHGVHRGTFIYSFRSQDICNRVLPELKDLCWVAVNVRGCKAYVQVRERVRAPERVNESEPTNVIAAKPGLITKVRALDGEKRVLPGTSVQQGQLLIAGVVDTGGTEKPSVTTRFLAGKGEVWARTWYDLTVRVPLTYEKKVYTGKEKRSHTLIWGENRLKIGAKGSSICNADCDKIKNQTQWTLFGLFALPVTWETETLLPYELEVTPRSRADAEAQGKDVLETYLAALLGETGSVTQRRFSTAVEGDTLVVTLSTECEEQIGKEVPIAVSEG